MWSVLVFIALLVTPLNGADTSKYTVSSVSYNPDSMFSGRIDRFLNGDHSPPKSAFSLEKHYPIFAYKPNCSVELIVQTWTNVNTQLPAFGKVELAVPTVTKSSTWRCFYRSSWLNDDENVPAGTTILPKERYMTTLMYCPSMYADGDDGHVDALNPRGEMSSFGLCPLLNNAIAKEGGSSIKLTMQLLNLPKHLQHADNAGPVLEMGPLTLKANTKRGRTGGKSTRYATNTLDKIPTKMVTKAVTENAAAVSVAEDRCAAEWEDVTLIGRCFGLKTHTEYPELKHITLVETADQCKAHCCALGKNKCVSWQYWTDIKLCKLGGAVRIGKEHANTNFWCDSEKPITWSGERVKRLPTGKSHFIA